MLSACTGVAFIDIIINFFDFFLMFCLTECIFQLKIPGWSSLSNARVTIFGDVFPLEANQQVFSRCIEFNYSPFIC